jgi:hypothetical protein
VHSPQPYGSRSSSRCFQPVHSGTQTQGQPDVPYATVLRGALLLEERGLFVNACPWSSFCVYFRCQTSVTWSVMTTKRQRAHSVCAKIISRLECSALWRSPRRQFKTGNQASQSVAAVRHRSLRRSQLPNFQFRFAIINTSRVAPCAAV